MIRYPIPGNHLGRCSALHLKHLNSLRKNKLADHTVGSEEADLTHIRIALVETLEGNALAVTDPVEIEVTEHDNLLTCTDLRHIRRSQDLLSSRVSWSPSWRAACQGTDRWHPSAYG